MYHEQTAYQQNDDDDIECEINLKMLERAVTAVEHLSQKLAYVVLPSGTKVMHILPHLPTVLAYNFQDLWCPHAQ
jgi:hypothetical protein